MQKSVAKYFTLEQNGYICHTQNNKKMENRIVIGQNARLMRESCGFKQEQVAAFLGIGRSAYSNYETGEREMPLQVMEKVADLYGCDLEDLYEENGEGRKNMLATAFRIENLSAEDMKQIADFKCVVKNYLKMNTLMEQ